MRVSQVSRYVTAVSVAALALAACGGGGSSGDAGALSGGDGAGTVTWWVPNWDEDAANKLVSDFQKQEPNTKVQIVITTWETMANKIKVALQAGQTPDVVTELTSRIPSYASKNQLLDVSGWYGGSMPKDDFNSSALAATTVDAKTYAVPFRWDAGSMVYNKELFAKAGITAAPTTEAELAVDSQKLKAVGITAYGWPYGNAANTQVRWLNEYFSQGGDFHEQGNGSVTLDADASNKALAFLAQGFDEGYVSKSSFESDNTALQKLFINKQVAMYFGGAYDVAPLQKAGINVGTAAWPGPNGPGTVSADGFSFMVPKDSKNQAGARKLVEFLASANNEAYLTATFPARLSAAKDKKFSEPLFQPFIEQQNAHGKPVPPYAGWPAMADTIYSAVQSVALGKLSPEEATRRIVADAANQLSTSGQ